MVRYDAAKRREKLYNLSCKPMNKLPEGDECKKVERMVYQIRSRVLIEMVSEIADERLEEKIDLMNSLIDELIKIAKGEEHDEQKIVNILTTL